MKVENYDDLKAEIQRLELKTKSQEQALIKCLHDLKTSLSPQNILLNSLSSLTGIPLNKSDFVKKSALVAVTYVLQKVLRKSELKLEEAVAELVQKVSDKFKSFFKKKTESDEKTDSVYQEEN